MYVIKPSASKNLELTLAQELFNVQAGIRCFAGGKILPKEQWTPIVNETSDEHFVYNHFMLDFRDHRKCAVPCIVDPAKFNEAWSEVNALIVKANEGCIVIRRYTLSDPLFITYKHEAMPAYGWEFVMFDETYEKSTAAVIFDLNNVLVFEESQFIVELKLEHYRNFAQFSKIIIYWRTEPNQLILNAYKTNRGVAHDFTSHMSNFKKIEFRLPTIRGNPEYDDSCIVCAGKCYERGYVLNGIAGIKTSMFRDVNDITQQDIMKFKSVMACYACMGAHFRRFVCISYSFIEVPTIHTFDDYLDTLDETKRAIMQRLINATNLATIKHVIVDKQKYIFVRDDEILYKSIKPHVKYVYLEKV